MRLLLWLGLEKDQEKWTECCGGGEVAVFAETVSKNHNVHTRMISVVTMHLVYLYNIYSQHYELLNFWM